MPRLIGPDDVARYDNNMGTGSTGSTKALGTWRAKASTGQAAVLILTWPR